MSPTRPIFIVHNNPWRGFVVEIEGTFVTTQIPGARILHTRILRYEHKVKVYYEGEDSIVSAYRYT